MKRAHTALLPRRATAQVNAALADTRVVLINGARQAGKRTAVCIVAGDRPTERRDLDRAQNRAAATADPVGFVDSAELLVIDEIQRVPELLAINAAPYGRLTLRSELNRCGFQSPVVRSSKNDELATPHDAHALAQLHASDGGPTPPTAGGVSRADLS